MNKTYAIQDREAGNIIENFKTQDEAEKELKHYELTDKRNNEFEENFYEIIEKENNDMDWPRR